VNNFRIGQKIVCVDGSRPVDGDYSETFPIEGRVYTIRGFESGLLPEEELGLLLDEIVNTPRQYAEGFQEIAFRADRFRPLVSPTSRLRLFCVSPLVAITASPRSDQDQVD
jgi:hypothetical protein